jgi:hypothetical protein
MLVLCPAANWAQNSEPWAPAVQMLPNAAPSGVVGEWSKSNISSVDFANPNTGSHASPSGERLNVRFFPDGHYKLGWLLQSSLYSCTSTVFGEKTGTYEIHGDELTMKDSASVLKSQDNCHREWNYEKHPPLRQSTYQWHLGRTKYGLVLVMRGPDGKDTVYARETGPGLMH